MWSVLKYSLDIFSPELYRPVWLTLDMVYVYISRLRRKLEEDPRDPKYLLTEHGLGYRFQKQTSDQK